MSNPNTERDERVTLPEWTECQSMFADGSATALSEFIRAYEPVQSTNPDDKAADEWRQALTAVLNAATSSPTPAESELQYIPCWYQCDYGGMPYCGLPKGHEGNHDYYASPYAAPAERTRVEGEQETK